MKKLRRHGGFSLPETLLALGIVIILLAVSAPLIINWRVNLKMAELDNHAREIFLAAQFQLTSKKADGTLNAFAVSLNDKALAEMPVDFDPNESGDWSNLRYLLSSDPADPDDIRIAYMIPEFSFVNEVTGNYLIEFNPYSASVYSVFYWEKGEPISYENDILTLSDRSRAKRTDKRLGYYGGDIEPDLPEDPGLDMQVELVNSEELYLKVSFQLSSLLLENVNTSAFTLSVRITDEHGNYVEPVISTSFTPVGRRLETYLLLDSLSPGLDFETLTKNMGGSGNGLTPGDNITAEVTADFDHPDYKENVTLSDTKNSLFQELTPSNDGSGDIGISVAGVRHLRNLDEGCYSPLLDGDDVVTVTQTRDIDFLNTDFVWSGDVHKGTPQNNPLSSFPAIYNEALFYNSPASGGAASQPLAYYNGGLHLLSNFVLTKHPVNECAGLFSVVRLTQLEGVRLVDTTVNGADALSSGALVGELLNSWVSDCGAYLSDRNSAGAHYSSIESSDAAYTSEMDRRYNTFIVNGGEAAGGLIGTAADSRIAASFAAMQVRGTERVGGFVGSTVSLDGSLGSAVNNCYASGDVLGERYVGGFAGYAGSLVAEDSYATGDVSADSIAGGFAGEVFSGNYIDCRSYGRVQRPGAPGAVPEQAGGFVGVCYYGGDGAAQGWADCAYLMQDGYNIFSNFPVSGMRYDDLMQKYFDDPVTILSKDMSFPYDAALVDEAFPFPGTLSTHYGDWPSRHILETSLVYYERYKSDEGDIYGYYCVTTVASTNDQAAGTDSTGELVWVLDTLREDLVCVEDGYALLTVYNLTNFSYHYDIGSDGYIEANTTLSISNTPGDGYYTLLRRQASLTFNGYSGNDLTPETDFDALAPADTYSVSGLYLFQLPYDLQYPTRDAASKSFYDRLTIYSGNVYGNKVIDSDLHYYYCAHFAKNAINPGITGNSYGLKANPSKAIIRTPRHLNALGRFSYYWNSTHDQYEDMIFSQEADLYCSQYTTSYCGRELDLYGTNVPIGNNSGSNIHQFRNTYDGNYYRIIDYRVSAPAEYYCAGLFGEIYNSTIRNVVMTVSEDGEGFIELLYPHTTEISVVGALVGNSYSDNGGTNEIINCSVSGYIVRADGFGGSRGVAVGGLIGISYADVKNCSAANTVYVNDTYSNQYYISIGGLIGSAYFGTIENCYSGGTIEYNRTSTSRSQHYISIGGAIGGILENYAEIFDETTYRNIYSYTRIDAASSDRTTITAFPVAAKHRLAFEHNYFPNQFDVDDINIENCYYLSQVDHDVPNNSLILTGNMVADVDSLTYEELTRQTFTDADTGGDAMGTAAGSYPYAADLQGQAYPFPAAVTNSAGYVHYGDWPLPGEDTGGA